MRFASDFDGQNGLLGIRWKLWLFLVLFCVVVPVGAQSTTDQSKSDLSYEIFNRKEVAPFGVVHVTNYAFLDKKHFSACNLKKLFTKLWVEESVPLLRIVIITDRENLKRRIKFDEHPLLFALGRSAEGRKIIEESYSEYLPTDSEFLYAQFFSNGEKARFFYTPSLDEPDLVDVSFDIRSKENDVCS